MNATSQFYCATSSRLTENDNTASYYNHFYNREVYSVNAEYLQNLKAQALYKLQHSIQTYNDAFVLDMRYFEHQERQRRRQHQLHDHHHHHHHHHQQQKRHSEERDQQEQLEQQDISYNGPAYSLTTGNDTSSSDDSKDTSNYEKEYSTRIRSSTKTGKRSKNTKVNNNNKSTRRSKNNKSNWHSKSNKNSKITTWCRNVISSLDSCDDHLDEQQRMMMVMLDDSNMASNNGSKSLQFPSRDTRIMDELVATLQAGTINDYALEWDSNQY